MLSSLKMSTVNCTRNNLLLNYDSGTENTAFFIKNSTEKKTANVLFSLRAIFDINYDSILEPEILGNHNTNYN